MKSASISEIKKELQHVDADTVKALCLRLAKYKKENKELLTYLLFEAHNEQDYITNVKEEVIELFKTLPTSNTYLIKKTLRKILRFDVFFGSRSGKGMQTGKGRQHGLNPKLLFWCDSGRIIQRADRYSDVLRFVIGEGKRRAAGCAEVSRDD